jgi:hypothetical protein
MEEENKSNIDTGKVVDDRMEVEQAHHILTIGPNQVTTKSSFNFIMGLNNYVDGENNIIIGRNVICRGNNNVIIRNDVIHHGNNSKNIDDTIIFATFIEFMEREEKKLLARANLTHSQQSKS